MEKWFKEFIEGLKKYGIDTSAANFAQYLYHKPDNFEDLADLGYEELRIPDVTNHGIENANKETQEKLFNLAKKGKLFFKFNKSTLQKDFPAVKVEGEDSCLIDDSLATRIYTEDDFTASGEEYLQDEELVQLGAQVENGTEFLKSELVPSYLKLGGTIASLKTTKLELEKDNLLTKEIENYLDTRIAAEKFYKKLSQNRAKPKDIAPVKKEDGTVIFEDVVQDKFQATWNGCYSCSYNLILQHLGLNITPKQIRAYRGDQVNPDNRALGDNKGNINELGGIVTSALQNTGMVEHQMLDLKKISPEGKDVAKEHIKSVINDAFNVHHSPVSLLVDGHYRTIVGYNPQTEELTLKDSFTVTNVGDPNKNVVIPLSSLLNSKKISLTHAVTINPQDPMKAVPHLTKTEFVNGKYNRNGASVVGPENYANHHHALSLTEHKGLSPEVYVGVSYRLPTNLVYTKEMIAAGQTGQTIEPADSPANKAFALQIDQELAKMSDVIPQNCQISTSGGGELYTVQKDENQNEKWTKLDAKDLAKYVYLNDVKKNIGKYTPWQRENALKPEVINSKARSLADDDGFKDAVNSFRPSDHNKKLASVSDFLDTCTAYRYNYNNGYNLRNADKDKLTLMVRDLNRKLAKEEHNNEHIRERLHVSRYLGYKGIGTDDLPLDPELKLNETVIPPDQVNKEDAKVWFDKFGQLLESKGFDLNDPYSLAMVFVSNPVDPQIYNNALSNTTKDDFAQKLDALDNADSYAFMKQDDKGKYDVERPSTGSNIEWLKKNMKTFDQVKNDENQVAHMYSMFKSGRLYLSSPEMSRNTEIFHTMLCEDENGNVKTITDTSHIGKGYAKTFLNADHSIYNERKVEKIKQSIINSKTLSVEDKKELLSNHCARTMERRICAAVKNFSTVINAANKDKNDLEFYEKLAKQSDIPKSLKTPEEIEATEAIVHNAIFNLNANKMMKQIYKVTGENNFADLMKTGKVSGIDKQPMTANNELEFIQLIAKNAENGIIVGSVENGVPKAEIYVESKTSGVAVAKNVKQYTKRLTEISKALEKTDSKLSKDSKAYKNIKSELNRLLEQADSNKGKKYADWPDLSKLQSYCTQYMDEKNKVAKLSDRQQRRLSVLCEISGLCTQAREDVTNPDTVQTKKQAIADKIVSAMGVEVYNKKGGRYDGKQILTIPDKFSKKRDEIMKSEAFKTLLASDDKDKLDKVYGLSGADILKQFRTAEKNLEAAKNKEVQNAPAENAPAVK